jgi:5-formyltetrahydrofolate cyclo-ligase
MNASELKIRVREKIWSILEEYKVARFPYPVRGRIPNFEGSERAARRILGLDEFYAADVVKVNPDYPQLEIRKGVLEQEKTLIMPSPRLRSGFLTLAPSRIPKRMYSKAATIRGAFKYGIQTGLDKLPNIDLVVCGSVAVTEDGTRVGKGGGYSEIEYAILRELGLIIEDSPIATTVHELQIVDEAPKEEHDFTVDLIATPERFLKAKGPRKRPTGIIWNKLCDTKLEEMPILKRLKNKKRHKNR